MHLPERFYLHGAGKTDQTVHQRIPLLGHESGQDHHQKLQPQDPLFPVDRSVFTHPHTDPFCQKDPRRIGGHRDQIPSGHSQISPGQADPHKGDISRFRSGKYLAPHQIGIRVQEPAGKHQDRTQAYGFGYFFTRQHVLLLESKGPTAAVQNAQEGQ